MGPFFSCLNLSQFSLFVYRTIIDLFVALVAIVSLFLLYESYRFSIDGDLFLPLKNRFDWEFLFF